LNFGLSPNFGIQLKVSLSEKLSQKLVTQCDELFKLSS